MDGRGRSEDEQVGIPLEAPSQGTVQVGRTRVSDRPRRRPPRLPPERGPSEARLGPGSRRGSRIRSPATPLASKASSNPAARDSRPRPECYRLAREHFCDSLGRRGSHHRNARAARAQDQGQAQGDEPLGHGPNRVRAREGDPRIGLEPAERPVQRSRVLGRRHLDGRAARSPTPPGSRGPASSRAPVHEAA